MQFTFRITQFIFVQKIIYCGGCELEIHIFVKSRLRWYWVEFVQSKYYFCFWDYLFSLGFMPWLSCLFKSCSSWRLSNRTMIRSRVGLLIRKLSFFFSCNFILPTNKLGLGQKGEIFNKGLKEREEELGERLWRVKHRGEGWGEPEGETSHVFGYKWIIVFKKWTPVFVSTRMQRCGKILRISIWGEN